MIDEILDLLSQKDRGYHFEIKRDKFYEWIAKQMQRKARPLFCCIAPDCIIQLTQKTELDLYVQGRYDQAHEDWDFIAMELMNAWESHDPHEALSKELEEKTSELSKFGLYLRRPFSLVEYYTDGSAKMAEDVLTFCRKGYSKDYE